MSEIPDPADQQLIKLLNEKRPEELSFEEIDLLRARLEQSPALRVALAEHLQTESYLSQLLGEFRISPDQIISKAEAQQKAVQSRPWQWLLGLSACAALIAVVVTVFWNALQPPEAPLIADKGVAEKSPTEVADSKDLEPKPEAADPSGTEASSPTKADPAPDKPVEAPAVKPVPKKLDLLLPAERFTKGNVLLDNSEFGGPQYVIIHSGGQAKRYVEYQFDLPRDGKFFVHLRYASGDSRPLNASLNGRKSDKPFASNTTGGFHLPQQKWFTQGPFDLRKGKNSLKLESEQQFPHVSRLVISTEPAISDDTAPQAAPHELAIAGEVWDEALKQAPEPFESVAFQEFDTSKALPQVPDLLRWFETVPNQPQKLGEYQLPRSGKCAEFDGVFRLRMPWQDNLALRLSLENHNRVRMHFYSGLEGITLVYYQDVGYTWCAYSTTRKAEDTHVPATLAITATDNGRCQRTEYRFGGPIEIRWHAGELILSRGDCILLRAPLAKPPTDVYFEGRAAFQGIAAVLTKDTPPPAEQRPILRDIDKPAQLDWFEKKVEGAKLVKHDNGAIELIADKAKENVYVSAPLGELSLCEVIVELEGMTPGSGVFLAPEKADNISTVRFANNQQSNPPSLAAQLRRDDYRDGHFNDYRQVPCMHVSAKKQFVRLIGGAGIVRYALSSDGVHWAQWEEVETGLPAGITSLVLDCTGHTPDCRIKLNRITVRKLPAIMGLADQELFGKVPLLTNVQAPSIQQWIAEVNATQPPRVDTSAWRRTTAIKALSAGCDSELGQRLVRMVLDDAEARKLPADQMLAVYDEAFQLLDTRNNVPLAQECWKRYFDLAARANRETGVRPFMLVRTALMNAPIWYSSNLRLDADKTIRLELIDLLYRSRWDETLQFCQQLRFFQQHQKLPLVEWAEATALRQLPGRSATESTLTRQKANWRPLLIEDLSKDTYNALAEMQAVLDSDAFDDAARMITSISPDAISGVAPHGRDRQLLLSLPVAIRLALGSYPALRDVMNQKHGSLAQLRVKQSINANNVAAVELAAVQFQGTEAAAEAHQWLGDRALSSGWFMRAMAEYQRAVPIISSTGKSDLLARMRLASAMQGQEFGEPVTRPVAFGETTISPTEFEALVADMRQANANNGSQQSQVINQRVFPAPAPTGYEIANRGALDGLLGANPQEEVTRDMNAQRIGWCERQISTLVEGHVLYVTNRFQIAAYDLNNGQRMWQSARPAGNEQRAREWSLVPMRPLVTGMHVFARLLYGGGATLVCLEKSSGRLLWSSEQRNNEAMASDPLLVQDQLIAFTIVRGEQGQGSLRLTTFDIDTGEPLVQHALLRLNEAWWSRRSCEVTSLNDAIVATLGGVTLCTDLAGNVRWIRKQVTMPPEEETSWLRQYFERPLLTNNRLYITQPGVRSIECVEPETGKLLWSKTLPDIESLIGAVDGNLIARTESAFTSISGESGQTLWRHERPDVFDAALLGGPGGLLYVQRQPVKDRADRFIPRLVWVDLKSGQPTASFSIPQLENNELHVGPLVTYNDRIFAFTGSGNNQPRRDLTEFIPKADAQVSPFAPPSRHDPWSSVPDTGLLAASAELLPAMALLTGGVNGESKRRDEAFGEKDVLGICVRPGQPLVFARDLPPTAMPGKLRMRFAHRGDNVTGKISVQFPQGTLWEQQIDSSSQQQWKDFEVDLGRIANRAGPLTVRVEIVGNGGELSTYWKKLEIAH